MLVRRKKAINPGAWLVTYSDMVTLLLCFFVLMYAFSTIDSTKWQILVRSLNPNASVAAQVVNRASEGEDPNLFSTSGDGLLTEVKTFDQLYWQMRSYVEINGMTDDVEVRGGDGYTFIVFRNNILFSGNSYVLRPEGRAILDFLSNGISALNESISEMKILGHTNQEDPNRPNDVRFDRFLASNRATEVLVYVQEKGIIEPRKLVGIGYGQFYPVAPFVLEEDRLQNRRVEILITESSAVEVSLEEIYSEMGRDSGALQ